MTSTNGWTLLMPVKPWSLGKARLDVRGSGRSTLARAFTLDVLDAIAGVESVGHLVLISAEGGLHYEGHRCGATVLGDRPLMGPDPLNAAIGAGRAWAAARRPRDPIAVVPGDLACLTSDALSRVLNAGDSVRQSFVPDMAWSGTTLLMAWRPALLVSAYGSESAARHAALGYEAVATTELEARIDVDTLDDLRVAQRLGLAPKSSLAAFDLGLVESGQNQT